MAEMLYEQVANRIQNNILNGTLQEHDRLSERKLAQQYNVSRTVVRESIKLLKEKGLVSTVYGRGSFVSIPGQQTLASKLGTTLDLAGTDPWEVAEARELMEKAMLPLIIARAEQADVIRLWDLWKKMESSLEDGDAFVKLDEEFHLVLSSCTHNHVLTIVTGALNNLSDRERLLAVPEIRVSANHEHELIVQAIAKKDEEGLRSAIEAHIACIRRHI